MKPLEDQPRCLLDRRTPGVEVLRNSSKPRKGRHFESVFPDSSIGRASPPEADYPPGIRFRMSPVHNPR